MSEALFRISATSLFYPPPHDGPKRTSITLSNESKIDTMVYKLKAVNPDAYVVKPRTKCILPGQSVEISFTWTPDVAGAPKTKEGFQLEVINVPPTLGASQQMVPKEAWAASVAAAPTCVKKQFLECHFGPAARHDTAANARSIPNSPKDIHEPPPPYSPTASTEAASDSPQSVFQDKLASESAARSDVEKAKESVSQAKQRVAAAEKTSNEHTNRAKELAAESRKQTATGGVAKADPSAMPVSLVIFCMLVAYILGYVVRVTADPLGTSWSPW